MPLVAVRAKRKTESPGTVIFVGRSKYVIDGVLGSGGFGDVYKVHLAPDKEKIFAMKTELISKKRDGNARLKVELNVFESIQAAPSLIDKRHFLHMHCKGKTRTFKFYVMDVVGYTLADVVWRMLKYQIQDHSLISVARQTLKAIEALHEIGWIHRDMKPSNFAIGRPPKEGTVYMLDFGLARQYREPDGRLRIPRTSSRPPRTITYCSLRTHEGKEQSRRDDLETWVFMMIELYCAPNITWRKMTDNLQILEEKRAVLERPRELHDEKKLRFLPYKFFQIIDAVNAMTFVDDGDFQYFYAVLKEIVEDEKIDMRKPLCWIGKVMPEKPKEAPKPTPEPEPKEEVKEAKVAKDKQSCEEESSSEDHSDEEERRRRKKRKSDHRHKRSHYVKGGDRTSRFTNHNEKKGRRRTKVSTNDEERTEKPVDAKIVEESEKIEKQKKKPTPSAYETPDAKKI